MAEHRKPTSAACEHNTQLVTIGMPVYNGEPFLPQALDSLLAQDYPHFELILSDNASSDRTEAICRDYQSRDQRIRYIRHAENHGSPWNFAFVAREARGDYFAWAAHDDLWHPAFLQKCAAALNANPEALLCCTEINFIDAEGAPSVHYPAYRNIETLGMSPVGRIHALLSLPGWFAMYGLMRREVLARISLGLNAYAWDVILLLEILLLGPNVKVPEPLFTFRIIESKTAAQYAQIFQSDSAPPATPYAGAAADLLRTIYNSPLSSSEKSQAFAHFILDCQKLPWRATIPGELLRAKVDLDEKQFALLLGLILIRSVPFPEIEHNPLCKAIYRSAIDPPDLPRMARKILSQPGPPLSVLAQSQSPRDPLEPAVARLDAAVASFHELLQSRAAGLATGDWSAIQLACGRVAEAELAIRRAMSQESQNAPAAMPHVR